MRALVQRTRGRCSLEVDGKPAGHFEGPGLVVLLGWEEKDREDVSAENWLRSRIYGLRIFPDAAGRMNLSLADALAGQPGGILWVSQFTLAARLDSGFRPSFTEALAPDLARARYENFVSECQKSEMPFTQLFGRFGAEMSLSFTNWGPVTIPLMR